MLINSKIGSLIHHGENKAKNADEHHFDGIEAIKLSKKYGNFFALKNVEMNFKKNQVTGLIGFNGSGKTTTYNIIADFIQASSGEVLIDGKKPNTLNKSEISYLAAGSEPQNTMRVMTHFKLVAELNNMNVKKAIVKVKHIAAQIDFTQFLSKQIKSLSKGNQQKLKIISSLLNPKMKYLILDEPFDGLDPIMVEKVKKIFMDLKNVTIIITSHRMEVVQDMCTEFYVLKDGEVADSMRTDDKSIVIAVNPELAINEIKKIKGVNKVEKDNDEILVFASSLDDFKAINKTLLKMDNFQYCSLKKKNIAESVFQQYGVSDGK